MKIIHISWDPLSAAPYRLVQVQRLFGLEAHLISEPRSYGNRVYPHDLAIDGDRELLAGVLAAADVVHYHNWWKEGELFRRHPWAWELVRRKPSVIQFHSPRAPWYEAQLREPSLTKLVVAQYQVRQYPECLPVPNAVPINDLLHRPLFLDNDPPVIAYTPPICDGEGWYDKGYEATVSVLGRGFAHRTVTDAPWAEVMAIRQRCDVAIDEVVTGSYHMCSLEALSQGLATVANLDAQTVDALERVTGTRRHPWVIASPATLEAVLARLVAEPAYRAACRQAARSYMERHWSPRAVADRFAEIYRASRERHGS